MATRADSHGDGQANLRFPYLRHGPSAVTHPALVPPLAIERYRVLEPHLADGIPLSAAKVYGNLIYPLNINQFY